MNLGRIREFSLPEQKILIVEDEDNLSAALRYNLEREGYSVQTAADGEEGLELARGGNPDLIILDIMLPKLDGLEVCRVLRRESSVPIILLTAKASEVDRVVGLELGADDYVTKPFSMRELMARAKAMLRRTHVSTESPAGKATLQLLKAGEVELDSRSHTAAFKGAPMELKPREFDLLALLLSNKGLAMTRGQILDRIWGQGYIGDSRTVDVHIRWLREKIEEDPSNPKRIITIRGVGYRFQA